METWQSDVGKIKSVLLRHPKDAFGSQKIINEQWEDLYYTDVPDYENALKEYDTFSENLKREGIDLKFLEGGSPKLDSIYVRDASISTDRGMIICNMGKRSRSAEPNMQKEYFIKHGVPVLGEIKDPGRLEGGDVAWINPRTLAVGRGYRTNDEGIRQLKQLTEGLIDELVVFHSPHYKGQNDVFHLMSVFSPVEQNMAVVYSPLMPVIFRERLLDFGYKLIEVPSSEFETLGCNVLSIAHGKCVMAKGNPEIKSLIVKEGIEVFEYEGIEISFKGSGGPTCLTRPLNREI